MEIEQLAIRDFLANCNPLQNLSPQKLNELTLALEIQYFRRGTQLFKIGAANNEVMLIRSGAIEVTDPAGELYGRYAEGEWMGYRSVMGNVPVSLDVKALEDTLAYILPGRVFLQMLELDQRIKSFFSDKKPERLRSALNDVKGNDYSLLRLKLRDVLSPALTVSRDTTVKECAVKMTEANSNTALILDGKALCGIVTDQDFRKRVIAREIALTARIDKIMTPEPYTLAPEASASEAVLLMARCNFRQLPVVSREKAIVGVVSGTDLLRSQSHNAVYLVGDIHRAEDVSELQRLSQHLPKALVNMVRSSLPAYDIAHAISSIGQAITRRLVRLAEMKFGAPPVPYAFVVAGSMARREQTAYSDQDNGMILSDDFVPELHDAYFMNVAGFVCDGLDACGYIYCPGDIMATNPKWRQPQKVWRQYFQDWVERPEPQGLLYASTFFDLRCLYGDRELLSSLQKETLEKTRKGGVFQAFMAANALSFRPPLGIFKGFVFEKNGDSGKVLDMKNRGVVPVIDLARIYALANGISALNTIERLNEIAKVPGGISAENVADLKDAFEFISTARLEHQAMQIEAGNSADNFVPPEQLSTLERRYLKDAFAVVSDVQGLMAQAFQANRFR